MNQNLKAFVAHISQDKAWLEALATTEDRDVAVAAALKIAAELGLALSPEDFEAPQGELSDDELQVVAGAGSCACAVGGGGTDTQDDFEGCIRYGFDERPCACVVYGEGWATELYTYEDDISEIRRCSCPMVGSGDSYE